MKFDGKDIFGTAELRVSGPTGRRRVQRSQLPGVVGFRNYRLIGNTGPDIKVWIASGRLLAFSQQQIEQMVERGLRYLSGGVYTFRTTGGNNYRNCELVDYRTVEPYRRVNVSGIWLSTTKVQATIEQASP